MGENDHKSKPPQKLPSYFAKRGLDGSDRTRGRDYKCISFAIGPRRPVGVAMDVTHFAGTRMIRHMGVWPKREVAIEDRRHRVHCIYIHLSIRL